MTPKTKRGEERGPIARTARKRLDALMQRLVIDGKVKERYPGTLPGFDAPNTYSPMMGAALELLGAPKRIKQKKENR